MHNPDSWWKTRLEGLWDAPHLHAVLGRLAHGMVLHGHLHRRIERALPTAAGKLHAVGATSASLHHAEEGRMAGFNLYRISESGEVSGISAHVWNPGDHAFHVESVPRLV